MQDRTHAYPNETPERSLQPGDAAWPETGRLRERVLPAAARLAGQAEDLTHRGIETVRASGHELGERARMAGQRSLGYARHEPLKTALMAAAAAALVLGLARLVSRRRYRA